MEYRRARTRPTRRADDLVRRLRDRFAPNGFLHYSQGKWYPGEPLPRWAFALYWRRDGAPIWQDQSLIAPEGRDLAPTIAQAQRFTEGVAACLGIAPDYVVPAYEDPLRRVIQESDLPVNIDPTNPKIDDPVERARLMGAFDPAAFAADRVCAAGAARQRAGNTESLVQRIMAAAPQASLSHTGQFAARISPAARIAAAIAGLGAAAVRAGRPVRAA